MSHDAPASSAPFERVLASRLEEIAVLAEAFEEWAGAHGVPARTASQVNLMLDELLTNVITYGYRNAPGETVRVEIRSEHGELHIAVTDHAFAYDPLQAREPDLESSIEDREIGGLGVHFVRTLSDEVSYERIDDGGRGANRVRIVKRFA